MPGSRPRPSSTGAIDIRILGPLEVRIDGQAVQLGAPLQRTLLAALTVDVDRAVSTFELTDRLWGEVAPATAPKSIQKYVSNLRRALGGTTIERDGSGYRLAVSPARVDARRFEAALLQAREEPDDGARIDRLAAALAAFRGEPLAGMHTDFAVIERARLEELRMVAVEDRLEAENAVGRFDMVAAATSELVDKHPYRERLWMLLMVALYRSGRQAEALRTYQRLRQTLVEDLGIEPSQQARDLEQRILEQDRSLGTTAGPRLEPQTVSVEERRLVTIVAATPASVRPALERIACDHGGRIVEGRDVALAVFGLPAHDDAEERAGETARQLAATEGCRCAVASGVATVLDSGDRLSALGEPIMRVQQMLLKAAPGSVVVDRQTSGRASDGALGPFVGRQRDIDRVLVAWEQCRSERTSHVVTLLGEAGIGKTRLLGEVRGTPELANVAWLQAGCLRLGDGPFSPIGRLVDAAFGASAHVAVERAVAEAELPDDVATWLTKSAGLLFDPEPAPPGDRAELLRAWARLLLLRVGAEGGVIVLEDIHWADPALGAFVEELVLDATQPLLVVCTARPEYLEQAAPVPAHVPATTIPLSPLGREPAERLALALLGEGVKAAACDELCDRAAGNPFFIHELARVVGQGGAAALPTTVRTAVAGRIDRAGGLGRMVVQAAAAFDAAIKPEAIAYALSLPLATVGETLGELRRRQLVAATDGEPGAVRVAHALVAEVALGLLTGERELELHERIVDWLRAGKEPRSLDTLGRIAFHAAECHRLASVLAKPNTEDLAHSSGAALFELGQALAPVDSPRALDALDVALERLSRAEPAWASAAVEAGRVATDLTLWDRSEQLLGDAIDAYRRLRDTNGEAGARASLALTRWCKGAEDAGPESERAVGLVADDPGPALAKALSLRLAIVGISGASADAIELGKTAAPVVDQHGSPEERARVRNTLGQARLELGDREGLEDLRTALDTSLEHGLTRQASAALNNLGNNLWFDAGPAEAVPVLERAVGFATERAHTYVADFASITLSEVLFDAGEWDRALTIAEEVIGRDAAAGSSPVGDSAAYTAGLIHHWRGNHQRASELLSAERINGVRAVGELPHVAPWLVAGAMAAAAAGDRESTMAMLAEMDEVTDGHERWRCYAIHDAVRLLVRLGELEAARRLIPASAQSVTRAELSRATALALVVDPGADPESAVRAQRAARVGWERFGHQLEAALAAQEEARWLVAAGRSVEAAELTDRARATLGWLGVRR